MATLKINEFTDAIKDIERTLSDPECCDQFLGLASSDTPVIEGILEQIAVIEGTSENERKEGRLADVRRDLVILLVLRNIEKTEMGTLDTPQKESNSFQS